MTKSTYIPGTFSINGERLNNTLHETCEWGKANRWGE